jgi:hypothetical protein
LQRSARAWKRRAGADTGLGERIGLQPLPRVWKRLFVSASASRLVEVAAQLAEPQRRAVTDCKCPSARARSPIWPTAFPIVNQRVSGLMFFCEQRSRKRKVQIEMRPGWNWEGYRASCRRAQTGELARPALVADDGGRRAAPRLCSPLRMTESCCRTDRLGYAVRADSFAYLLSWYRRSATSQPSRRSKASVRHD